MLDHSGSGNTSGNHLRPRRYPDTHFEKEAKSSQQDMENDGGDEKSAIAGVVSAQRVEYVAGGAKAMIDIPMDTPIHDQND